MDQITPGMLAYSRAGHDKDTLYYIVKADKKSVWLSDGRLKTVENPKRKNLHHVQVIHKGTEKPTENLSNEMIRRIIKLYLRKEL